MLDRAGPRALAHRTLSRLVRTHGLVHVHGAAAAGLATVANVPLPRRAQLVLAARDAYRLGDTDELFPGPHDLSTDPAQPDLFLGAFRY